MAAMKELATDLGIDYGTPSMVVPALLAGRWEIQPDRSALKVRRIRYPSPNRLGLGRRYPCPCEASTTVRCTRHV